MERRNLELTSSVTAEQWDIMARTARDLSPGDGFGWKPDAPRQIELYMRADDAPGAWHDWVMRDDRYGAGERPAATFLWNDGDTFARIDIDPLPEPPNVLPQDVETMQRDLENWVHNRWRDLRRASGIPFTDAGHVSQV
jgi:hypothetical protein